MKKIWKKYGPKFILALMGLSIVGGGYLAGDAVFKMTRPTASNPVSQGNEVSVVETSIITGENDPIIPAPTSPQTSQEAPIVEDEPITRPESELVIEKKKEIIDYKIIEEDDNSLYLGKTKIASEGSLGEKEFTYEIVMVDGKQVSKTLIGEKITLEPENRVIKNGTKKLEPIITKENIKKSEEIPFETRYVESENLLIGESEVQIVGVNGLRAITIEVIYTDGKETSRRTVKEEVQTHAIEEVVLVGIKVQETIVED